MYTPPLKISEINTKVNPSLTGIFLNNLRVAFLLVFLGPLTIGFGTFGVIIFNAILAGSFLGSVKSEESMVLLFIPHALIEIPVLMLAGALGISLTLQLFKLKFNLKQIVLCITIITIGLLIASTIETHITTIFVKEISNKL